MKTILFSIFTMMSVNYSNGQVKSQLIASTCENRGCTGSAYCSACKNCSGCAHCSSGGSCGVCSGGSSNYNTSKPKKKSKTVSRFYSYDSPKVKIEYYENESITIQNEIINLRENPSVESKIIEQLTIGDLVVFLELEGDWIKVQVVKNEKTGYLFSKIIKK
jgi:hypothetical protein